MRKAVLIVVVLSVVVVGAAQASTVPAYVQRVGPTWGRARFSDSDARSAAKAAAAGMKVKSTRRFDLVSAASDRLGTDGARLNQLAYSLAGVVPPSTLPLAHHRLVKSLQVLAQAYLGLNQAYDQWLYDFEQLDADAGDPSAVLADLDVIRADEKVIAQRNGRLPAALRSARGLQVAWRTAVQASARREGASLPSWVATVGK